MPRSSDGRLHFVTRLTRSSRQVAAVNKATTLGWLKLSRGGETGPAEVVRTLFGLGVDVGHFP